MENGIFRTKVNCKNGFVFSDSVEYLVLPKNEYINFDKIKEQKDLSKYMDEEDKFKYKIQTITDEETIYLNTLTMNEAYCYIGVKTPKAFIPSVRMYNYLMSNGEKNMHHNYNGFVELLSNCEIN